MSSPQVKGKRKRNTLVKFIVIGSLKDWDPILGLQKAFPPPTAHHYFIRIIFTAFPFSHYIKYQEKKIYEKAKNTVGRDGASIRNRYGRNITIIRQKLSNYDQYVIMSSNG